MGFLTSQDPNTCEGLESEHFVGTHRIPAELPQLTELWHGKLCQFRMDSGRASALELLQGLLTSQEVLQPSEPRLSLYSTKNELGSTI
jgi:hypothetical protein